jgi:serine protease
MAPASCANVVVVGAHTRSGDLAYYSNYGPLLTLTAPGGGLCAVAKGSDCQTDPTTTIGNLGSYSPGAENPQDSFSGTSAAAPHVSAAIALLLSVRPEMHHAEVVALLQRSARTAPDVSFCAAAPLSCGSGLLDARQALATALGLASQPFITVATVGALQARQTLVQLGATAVGATDFRYSWRQAAGVPVTLLNPAVAQLQVRTGDLSGLVSLALTVQSASQPQLSATALVSFIVDQPPTVPGGNLVAEVGKPYRQSLGIVDPENTPVQVAALGPLPDGARLVFDNGWLLAWDQPVAGQRSVYLSAVDGQGQVAGNTYVLEARSAAPMVTVSSGSGGAAAGGSGGGGALAPGWALGLLAAVLALARSRARVTPRR